MIWEPQKSILWLTYMCSDTGFCSFCAALAFGFGSFFGSIVLIPQWLQINLGYTATWAGYLTATMGFGSLTMSPIVAKLSTKYDPRHWQFWTSIAGCGYGHASFWVTDADFMSLAWPQILQGFAVPFFFIPLSNIAMVLFYLKKMASAAGLMNFREQWQGAIGASIAVKW